MNCRRFPSVPVFLLTFFAAGLLFVTAQETNAPKWSRDEQRLIKTAVLDSFNATHDGWSSDEVILQDELNASFLSACRKHVSKDQRITSVSDSQLNRTLINLRKAGKLTAKTTKRKRIDCSTVSHIAEIVSRSLIDKHRCSIDQLMCSTEFRTEFDQSAKAIDGSVDIYAVRKAAFQLRKTRRLKPELIGRIAEWGREIEIYKIDDLRQTSGMLSENPGIYIFRDSTGYLYIGQSENLRERIEKHLDESHNASLANYLKANSRNQVSVEIHSFDPDSKASETRVRRAYESELIASRKPRFNLQP